MKQTFAKAALAAAVGALVGASAASAESIPLEKCGRTADSFVFALDASGSMMESVGRAKEKAAHEENGQTFEADEAVDGRTRFELARSFIESAGAEAVKTAGMRSSVVSVAPFANLVPLEDRDENAFREALEARLPAKLEVFGRATWVGERAREKFAQALSAPQATVIITDGAFEVDENDGHTNPAELIDSFAKANPGACVHIVSAAYSKAERDGVAALAEAAKRTGCSSVWGLEELATNESRRAAFVEEVFYRDCAKVAAVELRGVNFAFDKSVIGENGKRILDDALKVVASRPAEEHITIFGWTDWTGSDAYNAKLSQRRADAVKAYFVEHGVDAGRISAEGKGKSFKYTNRTGDGRWMNRRVELLFGEALRSEDAAVRTAE